MTKSQQGNGRTNIDAEKKLKKQTSNKTKLLSIVAMRSEVVPKSRFLFFFLIRIHVLHSFWDVPFEGIHDVLAQQKCREVRLFRSARKQTIDSIFRNSFY